MFINTINRKISSFVDLLVLKFFRMITFPNHSDYLRINYLGYRFLFQWFAHTLEPVSFIVWDNMSPLNQSIKAFKGDNNGSTTALATGRF